MRWRENLLRAKSILTPNTERDFDVPAKTQKLQAIQKDSTE